MKANSSLNLLNDDGSMHVEWQPFGKYRVVAIGARLRDFNGVSYIENGVPMMKYPEMSVKDCRNIDGCIYYMMGRIPDDEFIRYIELFQATCKEMEENARAKRIERRLQWKEEHGINLNPGADENNESNVDQNSDSDI